jgi:hypothetical protein
MSLVVISGGGTRIGRAVAGAFAAVGGGDDPTVDVLVNGGAPVGHG